jgi:hypothetical protein
LVLEHPFTPVLRHACLPALRHSIHLVLRHSTSLRSLPILRPQHPRPPPTAPRPPPTVLHLRIQLWAQPIASLQHQCYSPWQQPHAPCCHAAPDALPFEFNSKPFHSRNPYFVRRHSTGTGCHSTGVLGAIPPRTGCHSTDLLGVIPFVSRTAAVLHARQTRSAWRLLGSKTVRKGHAS